MKNLYSTLICLIFSMALFSASATITKSAKPIESLNNTQAALIPVTIKSDNLAELPKALRKDLASRKKISSASRADDQLPDISGQYISTIYDQGIYSLGGTTIENSDQENYYILNNLFAGYFGGEPYPVEGYLSKYEEGGEVYDLFTIPSQTPFIEYDGHVLSMYLIQYNGTGLSAYINDLDFFVFNGSLYFAYEDGSHTMGIGFMFTEGEGLRGYVMTGPNLFKANAKATTLISKDEGDDTWQEAVYPMYVEMTEEMDAAHMVNFVDFPYLIQFDLYKDDDIAMAVNQLLWQSDGNDFYADDMSSDEYFIIQGEIGTNPDNSSYIEVADEWYALSQAGWAAKFKNTVLRMDFNLWGEEVEVTPKCAKPEIKVDKDDVLTISCNTKDAEIHYTLDGTEPTGNSQKYTQPITLSTNCTIKAIATKDTYNDSEIACYTVDWFIVATPKISVSDDNILVISCETPGATIHYTLDKRNPTSDSPIYTEPLTLTANCTVKAIATKDGYKDSVIANFDFKGLMVSTPKIAVNEDNYIIMSCDTPGATIHYTLDNRNPTLDSPQYTNPVALSGNCTIKAFAIKDGYSNSDITSLTVDWLTVATPKISISEDDMLTITCETEGATIRYTLDGTEPTDESTLYNAPVKLQGNCTIKAIATKDNYKKSEIASYTVDWFTVAAPKISVSNDDMLTITCETDSATIRYTLDGTEPTEESTLYNGPVKLQGNCTIKAIATKTNFNNSKSTSYTVDWFIVAAPTININEDFMLTITCDTDSAKVHYTLDGTDPTEKSTLYDNPIKLVSNVTIKARAYAPNYNPSEIATYQFNYQECTSPTIAYNGRYVDISAADCEVYYTVNGDTPTTASQKFGAKFDLEGTATVKAIAHKTGFADSPVASLVAKAYYDGELATVAEGGNLSAAFGWTTGPIRELKIEGSLNAQDIQYLQRLPELEILDIEDANASEIPSKAFAETALLCVTLPKTAETVGARLFEGCDRLAAVVWTSQRSLAASAMDGIDNPNLLLYTSTKYDGDNVNNVVENGNISRLELVDGHNFYAPLTFSADEAEYTHDYQKPTPIGDAYGWETICLPFDVKYIEHEAAGPLATFQSIGDRQNRYKPFWLYSLADDGWAPESDIKAYTPYLIAMPNNEHYLDEYNLAGKVTFSTAYTTIAAAQQSAANHGSYSLLPTTVAVAKGDNVAPINERGDMFEPDTRAANPFEAYLVSTRSAMGGPVRVAQLGDATLALPSAFVDGDGEWCVYVNGRTLHIVTSRAQTVTVYNVAGVAQRVVDLSEGDNAVEGLATGIYLVKNAKVTIRP